MHNKLTLAEAKQKLSHIKSCPTCGSDVEPRLDEQVESQVNPKLYLTEYRIVCLNRDGKDPIKDYVIKSVSLKTQTTSGFYRI